MRCSHAPSACAFPHPPRTNRHLSASLPPAPQCAAPAPTNQLTAPSVKPILPAVSKEADLAKFSSYLGDKGLRMTGQRLAIFEAAFAQAEHFTAEELLDAARALDDSVSRATVYRTLPLMVEGALLREVDIGRNLKYYLPYTASTHGELAQIICENCDKIFEISAPFMSWYGNTVTSKLGLTPVSQRLQVHARCNAFTEHGTCKNRLSA